MTEQQTATKAQKDDRAQRLADALRNNLRKRKQRARAVTDNPQGDADE